MKLWLHGLVSTIVNAVASAVVLVIADPKDFNVFDGGCQKLISVSLVFGLLGAANYLKQHPLPTWVEGETPDRRKPDDQHLGV